MKINWKKIVTRETTLLERYLRMLGYGGGVGKISRLKVRNVLTVSNNCVSEQYFDEEEIGKCAEIALKEFGKISHTKLFNHFGSVLLNLIKLTDTLRGKENFSKRELASSFGKFITSYGYGRGVILYAHFSESAFSEQLKILLAQYTNDPGIAFNLLTAPVESYRKGKTILDDYYKPKTGLKIKQQKLLNSLGTDAKTKRIIEYLKWLSYYHELAERVTSECFNELEHILENISLKTSVPVSQLKFYTPVEIRQLLLGDRQKNPGIIKEREKIFVLLMLGGNMQLYEGRQARAVAKNQLPHEKTKRVDTVIGQVAQSGKIVKGVVKIVKKQDDLQKMKKGDILVSPMTTPRLMSAIKLAKAIVTDEGGITSHAAIVSREFKIPCIIGTKIATKILKDGDIVEVDASKGTVRKIK